jgi:hypothetical protein
MGEEAPVVSTSLGTPRAAAHGRDRLMSMGSNLSDYIDDL